MFHPVYHCARIDRMLAVSGQVDDPLWQTAEVVELTGAVDGKPLRWPTTARLLYNDQYLYIGFTCADDYVWGTHTERDAPIYDQECVEAFICPSGKMRQYYEINVSPRNVVYDAFMLNATALDGERNMNYWVDYTCAGLITRTHIAGELGVRGATGWSAEYALPFRSLIGHDHLTPEPGDEWRLNLYRIDAEEDGRQEFYAWATMGKIDFHLPWLFGTLRFE